MLLKVDIRERKLIKILKAYKSHLNFENINIEIEKLDLGDAIICDDNSNEKLILERKSLNDLASSIKDGRYVEQSHRLTNYPIHNHNIVYIITNSGSKRPITKTGIRNIVQYLLYQKSNIIKVETF